MAFFIICVVPNDRWCYNLYYNHCGRRTLGVGERGGKEVQSFARNFMNVATCHVLLALVDMPSLLMLMSFFAVY